MGSVDDKPFWQMKIPDDFNSRIMLAAVLSLALVTLLVLFLHLYARYALRREARNQSIRTSHVAVITQINASGDPPKTGLDPAIIASLPLFAFKQANNTTNEDDMETECAVCLSKFEEEEIIRTLPNCSHIFHKECVDMWLGSNSTCPICRAEAEPKPESQKAANHAGISVLGSEGTDVKVVVGSSVSRLSSLRRMLSRERSSRRIQSRGEEHGIVDLERQ